MTSITQTGNSVTSKTVVLGYDDDQRLTSVDAYQSSGTSDPVYSSTYRYMATRN